MGKRIYVCSTCGNKYSKLGYTVHWFYYHDGCVGDCAICKGFSRLYLITGDEPEPKRLTAEEASAAYRRFLGEEVAIET